ncbi:MAG: phage baseplate assembly protein V [Deltaproteobacteria bacterium]|nr:phage baseplate assembly protein V [Deltaproteobacteria bacterium]
MIRGIVISVLEGVIKRLSALGRTGETIANREYFQHWGFTSRPLPGAEVIIINEGNHYLAIASDDRRYRLAVEEGEVALYTDEGDKIHLKRDKTIEIACGNKITITAAASCDITSPAVTINAPTGCIINSPSVLLGGSSGTMRKLVDQRILTWLRNHTHPTGQPPVQAIVDADVSTSITQGG